MPPPGITLALLAATLAGASCGRVSDATPHREGARPDIELAPDSELVAGRVPDGATMGSLLARLGLAADDVEGMLASIEGIFDARRVRTGQAYRVERSNEGRARLFEYQIDPLCFLRLLPMAPSAHDFTAEVVPYDVTTTTATVHGAIDAETSSLFAAMSKAGETPDLSVSLADVFAGEVDFNNELQPGDLFRLVVDKAIRDHRVVAYGPLEAATLQNAGRTLVAIRFTPAGAPPGYYDRDGKSLKRFFLRSPLKFDPSISSAFLPQPAASHPEHSSCAPRRGLPRAVGRAGGRRVGRDRHHGWVDQRRRAHGEDPACQRLRDGVPASVVVWSRRAQRDPREPGPVDRTRRRHWAGNRRPPALRVEEERRARQPCRRAPQVAAGRSRADSQMEEFRKVRDAAMASLEG